MRLVCGVDEVGRGPLAGPVVAAAVVLDPTRRIDGLRDSKQLSPKARERLAEQIRRDALCFAVAEASVQEIDALNILQASLLAMARAVAQLDPQADFALVDGNRLPALDIPARAIIKGDCLEPAISAASILAKVYRDAWMMEQSRPYPGYGFDVHAGYGTPAHLSALQTLGPCPLHRKSFKPVRQAMALRSA
ncbi:MAG TPA: ribonuclease HII [Burkholderiaceae bacterium]|nr:ribonuclease HII [Burkholderiaceae bacterium]